MLRRAGRHWDASGGGGKACARCSAARDSLRPGAPTSLGRAIDNDIVVADASVSRHHATIVPQNGGFALRDLSSQNGTFIRGQRIDGSRQLANGDEVRLGDAPFVFHG